MAPETRCPERSLMSVHQKVYCVSGQPTDYSFVRSRHPVTNNHLAMLVLLVFVLSLGKENVFFP